MSILKKIFDFFLFTSLFIAVCAVVMVYQTWLLFFHTQINFQYVGFVFFSTICSYNFHWLLTPKSVNPSFRINWSYRHRGFHLVLFLAGFSVSLYYFFLLSKDWLWLGIAALLTFLYSAPKISLSPFQWLKKFAVGKTIFLAMVWTYVTAVLPFLTENKILTTGAILFCTGQFFFLYAICILFDYRDREDDKTEGMRSMITFFSERGINILFTVSILTAVILFLLLSVTGIAWKDIIIIIIPAGIVSLLYNYAKNNFSDYLYYFVLDGLMMLSGILLWMMNKY